MNVLEWNVKRDIDGTVCELTDGGGTVGLQVFLQVCYVQYIHH